LGCPEIIVEIRRINSDRGHFIEGQSVFGYIERTEESFIVPEWSAETLHEIIYKWFLPSATVIFDCWKV